jgi:putative DNA primase/helicase
MTEKKSTHGLRLKGQSRERELASQIMTSAARGMSRAQAREIALTFNDEVNAPPISGETFQRIFSDAWNDFKQSNIGEIFKNLSEVETMETEFTVENFIPRATLTMFDGHPGQGKSLVTTHLAAALTRGRKFADQYIVPKGRVLFMAPEDDADRVLRPRLEAQGADIDKIRFMQHPQSLDEHGRALLRNELIAHPVETVFIDPITPFVGGDTDTYRANEVRSFMQPLALLAREFNISIVLVRHLKKGGADSAIEAGQGSMDFIATVRSGMMIFQHPTEEGVKILAHTKANWSALAPSLMFKIVSPKSKGMPTIEWLGEYDKTADELMSAPKKVKEDEACAAEIKDLLASGPMKARDAIKKLKSAGYSERVIDRAKTIVDMKSTRGPGATWTLN